MLDTCGCEYSGEEFDIDFEVLKVDWRHTIDKLKRLDTLPDDEAGEIEMRVKDLNCTTDEVIDKMERLLNMSEPCEIGSIYMDHPHEPTYHPYVLGNRS